MTTKRYFQGKTKREKAQPKRLKETRTFHQPSEPSVWGHPHTHTWEEEELARRSLQPVPG